VQKEKQTPTSSQPGGVVCIGLLHNKLDSMQLGLVDDSFFVFCSQTKVKNQSSDSSPPFIFVVVVVGSAMDEFHKDVIKLLIFFSPVKTSEEHQIRGPRSHDDSLQRNIGR
jgi:hypothetical protein